MTETTKISHRSGRTLTLDIFHAAILVLSVLLIVFISYDTFKGIPFLQDHAYMSFQFFVCVVFIADFIVEWALSEKGTKGRYFRRHLFFFLISIPYLNIINFLNLQISADMIYFARFLPLCRGALALAIVLDYIASNKITGIFVSYLSIMVLTVYFAGLIFYEREAPVNPGVTSYWDAFWWCALEATTLGSSVNPMTLSGRILAVLLSLMGIVMFPLFTVYLTSLITKSRSRLNFLNLSKQTVKTDSSTPSPQEVSKQTVGSSDKNT